MVVIHVFIGFSPYYFFFQKTFAWFEFIMSHIVMIFSQEKEGRWMWKKPPPASRKQGEGKTIVRKIQRHKQILSAKERLLKGIACLIIFLYHYRHFIRFRPYLATVKELILREIMCSIIIKENKTVHSIFGNLFCTKRDTCQCHHAR